LTKNQNGALMIEAEGLRKSYGSRTALKSVKLKINRGESVAILGPNGAGKTTLIKVLSTLSRPAAGKVRLAGLDISQNSVKVRRHIGVVSHQPFLYDNLSAYENLKFYAEMYDVPDRERSIESVAEQVGLQERLNDPVRIFSRGMQQRLSIARAVLHNPPILLLDEPETGLDPHASDMLASLLRELIDEKRTVLMTTHQLEWALRMGDRVMVLYRGRVVYEEAGCNLNAADLGRSYRECTGAHL